MLTPSKPEVFRPARICDLGDEDHWQSVCFLFARGASLFGARRNPPGGGVAPGRTLLEVPMVPRGPTSLRLTITRPAPPPAVLATTDLGADPIIFPTTHILTNAKA